MESVNVMIMKIKIPLSCYIVHNRSLTSLFWKLFINFSLTLYVSLFFLYRELVSR